MFYLTLFWNINKCLTFMRFGSEQNKTFARERSSETSNIVCVGIKFLTSLTHRASKHLRKVQSPLDNLKF
jgi:hypothetical protein